MHLLTHLNWEGVLCVVNLLEERVDLQCLQQAAPVHLLDVRWNRLYFVRIHIVCYNHIIGITRLVYMCIPTYSLYYTSSLLLYIASLCMQGIARSKKIPVKIPRSL